MTIKDVGFAVTDWYKIKPVQFEGEEGTSFWRTFKEGNLRVRMVEYGPGFKSDHYCERGHVLLVLEGELTIKLKDGRIFNLSEGTSFQTSDDENNPHLAVSQKGAKVFIVD